MMLNADDYRRRAERLEKLARETPNPVVRKALYSIAATWRALAEHATDPACRPLPRGNARADQARSSRA
jgi:hypothetical protein